MKNVEKKNSFSAKNQIEARAREPHAARWPTSTMKKDGGIFKSQVIGGQTNEERAAVCLNRDRHPRRLYARNSNILEYTQLVQR